jgi:hypothetical protein
MSAMTNYLENKLIDQFLRGQVYTFPATTYVGLLTAAPSDSSAGTEVVAASYARVPVTSDLASWAGTQAPGSVLASSGSSGETSNNVTVTFPAPNEAWNVVSHFALYDASTGGNMLLFAALDANKTINALDSAPSFAPGALRFQIDN